MRDRLLRERISGSGKSVLLLGPRQVGKSTLRRSLGPDFLIDLADEQLFLAYLRDPGRLKRELAAVGSKGLVVIDGIQRIPSLLNTVQSILDDPANSLRFVLTGPSARKLRRKEVNLLPGRIVLEQMDPLSYSEVADGFELERALQVGMLPGIYLGDDAAVDSLDSYAEVYLREEIRAEALTRNLGDYSRFLDVAAVLSGQRLNYSRISSDIEIPKETVRRFTSLLEDTLLMFRIPPFSPREKVTRRISQRDKILLFDVGVRNALLGIHRRPVSADQRGAVFEQWFILQVVYLNRILRRGWRLSSYRTDGGAEVDLVVERDEDIVAIEIKAGRNVSRSDTRGLASFAEVVGRYKPVSRWVVIGGGRSQVFDNGVRIYPYQVALDALGG